MSQEIDFNLVVHATRELTEEELNVVIDRLLTVGSRVGTIADFSYHIKEKEVTDETRTATSSEGSEGPT